MNNFIGAHCWRSIKINIEKYCNMANGYALFGADSIFCVSKPNYLVHSWPIHEKRDDTFFFFDVIDGRLLLHFKTRDPICVGSHYKNINHTNASNSVYFINTLRTALTLSASN